MDLLLPVRAVECIFSVMGGVDHSSACDMSVVCAPMLNQQRRLGVCIWILDPDVYAHPDPGVGRSAHL